MLESKFREFGMESMSTSDVIDHALKRFDTSHEQLYHGVNNSLHRILEKPGIVILV